MKFSSASLASKVSGAAAKPNPSASTTKVRIPTFPSGLLGGPVYSFKSTQDLFATYADVPKGGSSDAILAYAMAHNMPVFQFADYPPEKALLLFSWIMVPFCVVCMGFLYLDQSIAGQSWFYVYRYLLNNFTAPGPGTGPVPGAAGPMNLISEPPWLMLPLLLPSPFVKAGDYPPPNPNLRLVRGGGVPCDASGLDVMPSFGIAI
jgi:hypothetical protein